MDLSHCAKQILYVVISEFVVIGESVGSRMFLKKVGIDLSSVSICNVFVDLDEMGYLA